MATASHPNSRILIIDDQSANVILLERILRAAGYFELSTLTDSRQALATFLDFQPDLVLLDLSMPFLDGYTVMQSLRSRVAAESFLPILILTADISPDAKHRGFSLGANDFITKPFENTEVLLRVANLLETRSLHCRLQEHNADLDRKVKERTAELESAQREILRRVALTAEFRDDTTGFHTQRVGELSAALAGALGLPGDQLELIRLAAPLHDLGKVGVPDHVLMKPGKLSPAEYETMRGHVLIGARILAGSGFPLLQMAETIALTHHERWDGTGYPLGLSGEQIPLPSRIVAVADVFDALTHERPYKKAWTPAQALSEIDRQSGLQFDPDIVKALHRVLRNSHPQEELLKPTIAPAITASTAERVV